MKLSRNDVIVLQKLVESGCTNKICSTTIRKLSGKTQLSYFTIRNILKALTYAGLCGRGCDKGNAYTYFITVRGLEKIKELEVEVNEK